MPTYIPILHRGQALLNMLFLGLSVSLFIGLPVAQAQSQAPNASEASASPSGPVRLRPTVPAPSATSPSGRTAAPAEPGFFAPVHGPQQPATALSAVEAPPGEFERYVQKLLDSRLSTQRASRSGEDPQASEDGMRVPRIRRFGADFMNRVDDVTAAEDNPLVPPDYLVKPGDEIVVTLWGSVDAEVRAVVDRSGRISIPRVGPIFVSGVRYSDLEDTISKRVSQVFRNFELSAALGRLRGQRVFVTGYVSRPGAYSVSSLSTLTAALTQSGGPTAAGSFRIATLRREGKALAVFDLYDFLLKGDRSADLVLQTDDVIQVGPVGPQVALIGSINQPAIFEIKVGETVKDVVAMAGGFSALADRSRLTLERLGDRSGVRIREIALPANDDTELTHGDVLRAFSAVDVSLPIQRQNKRVRIDGEVQRPGEYVLPPNSSVADAMRSAGGLTPAAFLFGAEFSRESVRRTQQENYERALRDLETEFTRAATTQRTSNADEAAAASARGNSSTRLIERLRAIEPTGRIVLQMQPDQRDLPDLALEDGDRIYIPPRATTIGVFGSVFNGGSYLFNEGRLVGDYLRLAGGPTRGADTESAFLIRANGSVISGLQSSSFWRSGELKGIAAMPGDTIFVPEEINKTTFIQTAKDWTQILSQFGLGLAAIRILGN